MKLILISIIAFLIFTIPVFSELTVQDLEKIRSIVKESEDRLKEHVDDKITEMDKRLNIIFGFVIALIGLIVVVVGIPQIIMAWRERKEKEPVLNSEELKIQGERIEGLEKHIRVLIERTNAENPTVG